MYDFVRRKISIVHSVKKLLQNSRKFPCADSFGINENYVFWSLSNFYIISINLIFFSFVKVCAFYLPYGVLML